jgi:hypothetical protein
MWSYAPAGQIFLGAWDLHSADNRPRWFRWRTSVCENAPRWAEPTFSANMEPTCRWFSSVASCVEVAVGAGAATAIGSTTPSPPSSHPPSPSASPPPSPSPPSPPPPGHHRRRRPRRRLLCLRRPFLRLPCFHRLHRRHHPRRRPRRLRRQRHRHVATGARLSTSEYC